MSQIPRKDTFDRICDDLCEVLLSYETFTDRFRHQSVSKQFQRLVYTTQKDMTIDYKLLNRMTTKTQTGEEYFDTNRMAIIMRKCPNVQRIDCSQINNDRHLFESIHQFRHHWPNLKELYLYVEQTGGTNDFLIFLCPMFGKQLTRITEVDSGAILSLTDCPNLSHLILIVLPDAFGPQNKLLVKNLVSLKFNMICTSNITFDNNLFKTFIAANLSLKRLKVKNIPPNTESKETTIQFLKHLTRLTNLNELSLTFCLFSHQNHHLENFVFYCLYNSFRDIGLKCVSLKKLRLQLSTDHPALNDEIIDSIQHFRCLKRLELILCSVGNSGEWDSFESMSRWPQCISHLSLSLHPMSPEFIAKIDTILPALQYLKIYDQSFSENRICLNHYSRLPLLQTLIIDSFPKIEVNLNDVNALYKMCQKLRHLGHNIDIKF